MMSSEQLQDAKILPWFNKAIWETLM